MVLDADVVFDRLMSTLLPIDETADAACVVS